MVEKWLQRWWMNARNNENDTLYNLTAHHETPHVSSFQLYTSYSEITFSVTTCQQISFELSSLTMMDATIKTFRDKRTYLCYEIKFAIL